MHKPSRITRPNLAKAWDEYGHSIKFEDLVDIKMSHTHGYCAVAWMEDGKINFADLSRVDGVWEMNNDGHGLISVMAWNRARPVPHCDALDIPEDEYYKED